MSQRLTPEEKALRAAIAEQKRTDRENRKKQQLERVIQREVERQAKAQLRAEYKAKREQRALEREVERQEKARIKAQRQAERAERAALKYEEERLKQAGRELALELTLMQEPVEPPRVQWNKSNIKRVRSFLYIVNGYLNDGEDPPPRDVGMFLYEITGSSLGVYTEELIREIKRKNTLQPCVEEHPYGRNKSGEMIIEWIKQNRNATIEEVCAFVEQFVQFTYSTDAENNGPLKREQNKDKTLVPRHWTEIYKQAGVRWVYIHFPPDMNSRTAQYVIQCGELLGIC